MRLYDQFSGNIDFQLGQLAVVRRQQRRPAGQAGRRESAVRRPGGGKPSARPSMVPNAPAAAPIDARNAGCVAVTVSWLLSLNSDAMPTPNTVGVSHRVPERVSAA
jgi:hypothetical protein